MDEGPFDRAIRVARFKRMAKIGPRQGSDEEGGGLVGDEIETEGWLCVASETFRSWRVFEVLDGSKTPVRIQYPGNLGPCFANMVNRLVLYESEKPGVQDIKGLMEAVKALSDSFRASFSGAVKVQVEAIEEKQMADKLAKKEARRIEKEVDHES